MGRKIFITYKYGDTEVQRIDNIYFPKVRDYVDILQLRLEKENEINKGELDGQDLSAFKDETIESKLRDKIYDSSVTLILISKNMKEYYTPEEEQWIPWEISYSLKEHKRNGRTSLSNALLAIVIPDKYGSYSYFIEEDSCPLCHCRTLNTPILFNVIKKNMFNIRKPSFNDCNNHSLGSKVFTGYPSYIYSVKWTDFLNNIELFLKIADKINENIDDYDLSKLI